MRSRPVWAACRIRSLTSEAAVLDLRLLDEDERLVLDVRGFELAAPSPADRSLFEVEWRPRPPAAREPGRGPWLILSDGSGVGADLARRLGPVPHVLVRRGAAFGPDGSGGYTVDPRDPAHFARLLGEAFGDGPPERVVQLFGLDAPRSPRPSRWRRRPCCAARRRCTWSGRWRTAPSTPLRACSSSPGEARRRERERG
ncbi:hypothetical protein ACFQY7_21635 [Actinomadura luteofluorescens]|uniref:KR prefix domain-containing protein n=1 Tax=Actinomadura luteofluorescens TaxID=46163 RepID=UPI00362BB1C1